MVFQFTSWQLTLYDIEIKVIDLSVGYISWIMHVMTLVNKYKHLH